MALIKFGALVSAASGSVSGNTYARNRFGYYCRARSKPVNPGSVYQEAIRSIIAYLTNYWHETLTPAQRIAWETYAVAVNMKNKLGETIHLTGFNHFIRVNAVRKQCENSICPDAPTILSLPDTDPSLAISASAESGKITVTWDDTLPWSDIPASILALYQGRPRLATRNFFGGPWRKLGYIPGNGESPTEKDAVFTLIEGQLLSCYARIATGPTDSRLSEPMIATCTIGA